MKNRGVLLNAGKCQICVLQGARSTLLTAMESLDGTRRTRSNGQRCFFPGLQGKVIAGDDPFLGKTTGIVTILEVDFR